MEDEINWNRMQKEYWASEKEKKSVLAFFKRFNQENFEGIYNKIISLKNHDDAREIFYLIAKIIRIIEICDFLDKEKAEKNHDIDEIKIYLLISHSEIAARLVSSGDGASLVKKFFQSEKTELNYKIHASYEEKDKEGKLIKKILDASYFLYLVRCDYTHNGNFTGNIFRTGDCGKFYVFDATEIGKNISVEFNLSYNDFMNVYVKALVEIIEKYLKK